MEANKTKKYIRRYSEKPKELRILEYITEVYNRSKNGWTPIKRVFRGKKVGGRIRLLNYEYVLGNNYQVEDFEYLGFVEVQNESMYWIADMPNIDMASQLCQYTTEKGRQNTDKNIDKNNVKTPEITMTTTTEMNDASTECRARQKSIEKTYRILNVYYKNAKNKLVHKDNLDIEYAENPNNDDAHILKGGHYANNKFYADLCVEAGYMKEVLISIDKKSEKMLEWIEGKPTIEMAQHIANRITIKQKGKKKEKPVIESQAETQIEANPEENQNFINQNVVIEAEELKLPKEATSFETFVMKNLMELSAKVDNISATLKDVVDKNAEVSNASLEAATSALTVIKKLSGEK